MIRDLEIKNSGTQISIKIPGARGKITITKPWHTTQVCYWNKKRWEIETVDGTAIIKLPNYRIRIWYEGDVVVGTFEKN